MKILFYLYAIFRLSKKLAISFDRFPTPHLLKALIIKTNHAQNYYMGPVSWASLVAC
jgi:hypothetical protein